MFDYYSLTSAADIKQHTLGKLRHVLDCISTAQSMAISVGSVGSVGDLGGIYFTLRLAPADAVWKSVLMSTIS
jgi:hypothetical protein